MYLTAKEKEKIESVFIGGAAISGVYITTCVLKDFNNGTTRNTLKSIMVTSSAFFGFCFGVFKKESSLGAIVGAAGAAFLGDISSEFFLNSIGYNIDSYAFCKHCKSYFDHHRYVEKRAICADCRERIKAYGYKFY